MASTVVKKRKNFLNLSLKRDVSYGYIHEDFQEETMLSSFTPTDQNQDCVTENSVNLLQGNIIDDVLPLVFYEPSANQWLVHEESTYIGFYNTDHVFDEYKDEEDV
jgi:hypothetical protein